MEFKGAYLQAMRDQAPKMFMDLRRSGKLDQFVQEKSMQAHQMLDEILRSQTRDKNSPPTMQQEREAEEQVRALMIEFPPPEVSETPEPPDDLPKGPMQMSRAKTMSSSRAP